MKAKIDGEIVDCAFAGGMEFTKPTFVDIDADGDLDIFIGDKDGSIRFFRNEGTPQNPCWEFVSDFYDSAIAERSFPAFADIDDDGDPDLFVGNREGKICFFRNDGNINSPLWSQITDFYDSIDVGSESTPVFVDMDGDLDLDLFVGKENGMLSFYRNVGTKEIPCWELVSENYDSIDVGAKSTPAFVDLDADGDFDLFLGEEYGNVNFYRNIGSDTLPQWEPVTANYNSIEAGKRSSPIFADIDGDSDFDLFIGQDEGKIFYYRNDGTIYLPSWTPITQSYLFIDLGTYSHPALVDIDADGDMDLFVGEYEGNINFYQNQVTVPIPSWSINTENYFAIEADDFSAPTFADIDQDGDSDLFIGRKDGKIHFYENIGTAESPFWNFIPDVYNFLDVGTYVSPAFVDIDGDLDLDMFVGQVYGKIYFYLNDGSPQSPSWTLSSDDFESIDVGWYSVPMFGDLDSDGDFDLLVGNEEGRICLFQNEGTAESFSFLLITDSFDSIDVGERSTPVLCDFDSDGDLDLFAGESKGGLHFYKNLTLNSIRGKVTDQTIPSENAVVYLSGEKEDSTFTDSSGNYEFVGLSLGNYCVFRDSTVFQYCFFPLESDTFEINFAGVTHVDEFTEQNTPKHLQLFPNYPNPFNPETTIIYFLPADGKVKLIIYNLRGEKVKELTSGFQTRGWKKVIWDGRNSQREKVASGIYLCRLQTEEGTETIRMVLLK
ncbi:hypothetical protein AMJ44_12290 [candidate division WOR-1 bacterium DG_54_3]|uniref:FlgD Ig-like domain-containing protein n=1 Tax=candidate division WOR-1 bacterium DG_54_3 TaxID=1703775 RepID=A0A0S7XRK7_UNCSA|nr:MAG: hypothetical protein AMJ44_12290 [candidate division WOR-1 bacterium DG_54_3]